MKWTCSGGVHNLQKATPLLGFYAPAPPIIRSWSEHKELEGIGQKCWTQGGAEELEGALRLWENC